MEPRALLEKMFKAAIAAAQPALCVPPKLPAPPTSAKAT
jgi:hydroxypyruvate reductase